MNAENKLSALLVGEYESDRALVREVFRKLGWKLFHARDRRRAMACLERYPVHVVIAESDLPNWNWKGVLRDLHDRPKPPQLIVTALHADESLWSEVLNFGGYDVIAQPFNRSEVERVIASAHRHYDYAPMAASA